MIALLIIRMFLYRYWWNTRIFPLTKKKYLHRAQWRYYFYLSRVRILVSPWLQTGLANCKRASRSGARPVLLKFHQHKWNKQNITWPLILSSRAESISHELAKRTSKRYFQHSKIKFVSLRGHVISSFFCTHYRALRLSGNLTAQIQKSRHATSSSSLW